MFFRHDSVALERLRDAMERTSVQCDDGSSRFGGSHKRYYIAANTRDAGHLGDFESVEFDGNVIGHLRGARRARARIDQRKFRIRAHKRIVNARSQYAPTARPLLT